jgi:hypothetical protein
MLSRRLPSTSWGDDLGILIGGIFPGEMTGVDQVELALGQMLMETVRECIAAGHRQARLDAYGRRAVNTARRTWWVRGPALGKSEGPDALGQGSAKLPARADAELGEHLA